MENTKFKITTFKYSNKYTQIDFDKWVLPSNYHCIYILENGKDAYIGETLVPKIRASQHIKKFEKYDFKQMHVITSDQMEETPAKHFEKLLIILMKIDDLFNILNKNNGNTKRKNIELMRNYNLIDRYL